MSCPFSLIVSAKQSDFRSIRKNGFIACQVYFLVPRVVSKRLGFCLHCKELLSYNGALKHCKQLAETQKVHFSSLFCPEKLDFYKQQIFSDVDLLWERWSQKEGVLSKDSTETSRGCDSETLFGEEVYSQHDTSHMAEESCTAEPSSQCTVSDSDVVEQDPLFEEQWDCLEECLLNRWSCFSVSNTTERFEEAEAVMNTLFVDLDEGKRNTMKSRVITLMMRQLSSRLSLTRNQNDQVVSFFKRVIVFISPENEEISRRIFASHTSCQRQSLKDVDKKFVLCKKYMNECLFFSLAVDTALFGNQHFISCIVRFTFDNNMLEIPLFISSCAASSGKEMARYIFERLIERNACFEKFVSVATDGAANMIGKFNGMSRHLKTLIENHCRSNNVRSPTIHTMWCFAHRINLVTKAFLATKPVSVVLAFSDWFAKRGRQVAYKRFLMVTKPDIELRVIPQPSETRWLYYRDVVRAILSQTEHVEAFVCREAEFVTLWNRLRKDLEECGQRAQINFSFKNPIVKATFDFTLCVLEMLGRVNTVFQERLSTTPQLWDIIVSLKANIQQMLTQTSFDPFSGLVSLNDLRSEATSAFHDVLRQLLHCLEKRFPVPSTSFDMKCRRNAQASNDAQHVREEFKSPSCSVKPKLDFFAFPRNFIDNGSIPSVLDDEMKNEVQKMAKEITVHQNEIIRKNQARREALSETVQFDMTMPISLADVFSVVDSGNYPLLWNEYLKANTIMPTTVCCEQSFSVMKRSTHINMKPESFITNATNKLYERAIPKLF